MSAESPGGPLRIRVQGQGSPRVVLVHGFGASAHFWRHWAPKLAAGREVWNVELTGFGPAGPPPEGDASPPAQARALVCALGARGGQDTVLVGHSLGGAVVLIAALLLEDEGQTPPKGLVIVSGAAYPQRLPRFLTLARIPGLALPFLLFPPPRALLRAGIRGIVHDPETVTDELVDGYHSTLGSRAFRRELVRAARGLDPSDPGRWSARYSEITSPTLLLWGEEDRIIRPEIGERLERALADARRVTLPGVGHLPPEEAPLPSLVPVLEFLAVLEGPERERRGARRVRLPE